MQPVPADEHGIVAEYRAPEQLAGAPGDASSDVFTLGVLLFELTTGVHPFTGPTAFKAARAVTSQRAAPRPSALAPATPLPSQVEALIVRALAPQPSQRFFKDVAEMAQHLALIRRSPGLTPRTSAAPAPPTAEDEEPTQHGALPESAEDRTTIVSLPSSGRGSLPSPAVRQSGAPTTNGSAAPTNPSVVATPVDRSATTGAARTDALPTLTTVESPGIDSTEVLPPPRATTPTNLARADEPRSDPTEVLPPHRSTPPTNRERAEETFPDPTEAAPKHRTTTPKNSEVLADRTDPLAKNLAPGDATLADRTQALPETPPAPATDDSLPVDRTVADRLDRTVASPARSQAADLTLVLPPEPAPPPRPAPAPREPAPALVRSEDDDRTVLMARDARPAAVAGRPVAAAPVPAAAPPAARRSQLFWPVLFCLISLGLALVALLILLRA
ncbi:protein kinase domain-containing protein [Nannocystis pusilla]|uniref:protein kinase domain-containing protein n=1 Tax=Nannocystis pusilla TaxID=889268 RepID=UPI003DA307A0